METFLAVLMVIGIYLVFPAILGLAIGGICIVIGQRRTRRAKETERARSLEEAVEASERMVAEAKRKGPVVAAARQKSRETTKVV